MQTLSVQLFNPLGIPCECTENPQGIYIECLKTIETSNIQNLSVQLFNPLGIPVKTNQNPERQEQVQANLQRGAHGSDIIRG